MAAVTMAAAAPRSPAGRQARRGRRCRRDGHDRRRAGAGLVPDGRESEAGSLTGLDRDAMKLHDPLRLFFPTPIHSGRVSGGSRNFARCLALLPPFEPALGSPSPAWM
jgi:hypothetical protein